MNKLIRKLLLSFLLFFTVLFLFSLPSPLFSDPVSDVLLSADSTLLGARVAADGQWRFPATQRVPDKFSECLIRFEDKRFYAHLGIDPLAIGRAIRQNLSKKKVVSGGSTLTMQLVRLHRKGKARVFHEKIIEAWIALRLECSYSKKSILALYASNAPFGGNIVGVECAAWRYFGRSLDALSWAESATLAVLPNSPALIHPGRNRHRLLQKRNQLLKRLYEDDTIDRLTYELSCEEPLPQRPYPLPDYAPHFLNRCRSTNQAGFIYSTIDPYLQTRVNELADRYSALYSGNQVRNIAILILDTSSGEVLSYVGNSSLPGDAQWGRQVDMIRAERSTGSLLKPFLYGAMMSDGQLLPNMLVPDIPLYIDGFSPQNYNKDYNGVVPAHRAISRSLNVPLVRMLLDYDYTRFHHLLQSSGMTTLHHPASHYGSSLILGGAEGTLWDMTGMYASMGRNLLSDTQSPFSPPVGLKSGRPNPVSDIQEIVFKKDVLWFVLQAMSDVNRPEEESDWSSFSSMKQVGWKTGTSFGGRDAWAIGITPEYTVGVWVGNASGEGRPGVTGVGYAAPVLFDAFSLLPPTSWFEKPVSNLIELDICRESGHKAGPYCDRIDTLYMPAAGIKTTLCPYHKRIYLDESRHYRVNATCCDPQHQVAANWFVLPPAQEWYFRSSNPGYEPLPELLPGCEFSNERQIEFIYPRHGMRLFLPKGFTGQRENIVFKAAHIRPEATLYWHLNDRYIGETNGNHQLAISPEAGNYTLLLIDESGDSRKIRFEIVSR